MRPSDPQPQPSDRLSGHVKRLNSTEWRAPIYLELITDDLERMSRPATVLEVGCGVGFDGNPGLQRRMAERVDRFIGIEPDAGVDPLPHFHELVRAPLEEAQIDEGSVDLAYSIMVMEHLERPGEFMEALGRVLRPGGVYWGFTVDRRHWFTRVANLMSTLQLKSAYLGALYGAPRGRGRYRDYPTAYRLNTPSAIDAYRGYFSQVATWNVGPCTSAAQYAPPGLRTIVESFERGRIALGGPRTDFVVRLVR